MDIRCRKERMRSEFGKGAQHSARGPRPMISLEVYFSVSRRFHDLPLSLHRGHIGNTTPSLVPDSYSDKQSR